MDEGVHQRRGEERAKGVLGLMCANVNGLRNKAVEFGVGMAWDGWVKDDIIGVLETRMHQGDTVPHIPDFEFHHFTTAPPGDAHAHGGIGVWLRESGANAGASIAETSERAMWVRVPGRACRPTFVAMVYAPVQGTEAVVVDAFWEALSESFVRWSSQGDVVVMGDLNARIAGDVGDHIAKPNSNGMRLLRFVAAHKLVVLNSEWAHGVTTFRNSAGTRSSIVDYVLVQESAMHRVVSMEVVEDDMHVKSDHKRVRLEWMADLTNVPRPSGMKQRKRWKLPTTNEGWERYSAALRWRVLAWIWREARAQRGDSGAARVERVWTRFKKAITDAADSVMPRAGGAKSMKGWDEGAAQGVKLGHRMWKALSGMEADLSRTRSTRDELGA